MRQLDLFALADSPPPPERRRPTDPPLWIARLLILREPKLDEASVLRDIALRRGLNILWAPPLAEGAENRLYDGSITGHTAGKTTFCRLVRYLLGEQRFGTHQAQERIREALAHGWVVGEILVAGERWVVGRPFALGVHPFAARDVAVDKALAERVRGGYQDFLAAAAAAALGDVPVKTLPHARQPIGWDHVLPWLTRDQEARFASLVEWRDPTSESESPKLTTDDRHVILRALLGLMYDAEGEVQRRAEELAREKQKLEDTTPELAHRAAEERRRLAKLLGVKDDGEDAGPLFAARLHEHVATRKAALDGAHEALSERAASVEQARAAWREAVEFCGARREQAQAAAGRLPQAQAAAGRLPQAQPPAHPLLARSPAPGFCPVPLAIALERGCPLSALHAGGSAGDAHAVEAPPVEAWPGEALVAAAGAAQHALEQAQAEALAAEERYLVARAALQAERERLAEENAAIAELSRVFRYAESADRELRRSARRLEQVSTEAREASELQAALRREHAEALGRLSDRFREVVRALLGSHVDGRVEVKSRRLELRVEDRGEREGAAMTTIKLLSFDLAALKLGVEGSNRLPCFLVHDGPREADMDGRIYERLFLFARSLEDCSPGQPGFQYIVTTTAPPPPQLQQPPWRIEPLLDASSPEGRLFRMDL